MSRKKLTDQNKLLCKPIIVRFTMGQLEKLQIMQKKSDCSSIGELVRRIVANRKVNVFTKDASMDGPMEEMALIRKELKSIGVNINQITRSFNQDKSGLHREYYISKNADLYHAVDLRVEKLLAITAQLAAKWLQK